MNNKMKKNNLMIMIFTLIIVSLVPNTFGGLVLDNIQYDPAIIAAGDEVDIVIQFHDESVMTGDNVKRVGNSDYTFEVLLESDDTLTKNYVTFSDAEGDDQQGRIFSGEYYNKKFRVKVNNNAPAGNYEFKLSGRWYYKGEAETNYEYLRFQMPVKKEGIILGITTLETIPSEVRPGDNFVEVKGYVENSGEKDAKSVEINLVLPDGIESSYTDNNRVWVGRINTGEKKELTFFLDVDDDIKSGVQDIVYSLKYMDIDNNNYAISKSLPFRIKPRPYLEVVESTGTGLAGENGKLHLTIKNTGDESAEAVDVRILKQNSQPFTLDVRSDYIGELKPGETGLAIFDLKVSTDAEIKQHNFKVLIRSKGDTDEGDDKIYTYNRRAQFDVTGIAPNKMKTYGLIGATIVVLFFVLNKIYLSLNKKTRGKRK